MYIILYHKLNLHSCATLRLLRLSAALGVPDVTAGCGGESRGSGVPTSWRCGVPGNGAFYVAGRHL